MGGGRDGGADSKCSQRGTSSYVGGKVVRVGPCSVIHACTIHVRSIYIYIYLNMYVKCMTALTQL